MTREQLISALGEECRWATRSRIEDFLAALFDLCAEHLGKGAPFHLGQIGFLLLNPRLDRKSKKLKAAVTFESSNELRKRLALPEKNKNQPDSCGTCGLRPVKVARFNRCGACMEAARRKR